MSLTVALALRLVLLLSIAAAAAAAGSELVELDTAAQQPPLALEGWVPAADGAQESAEGSLSVVIALALPPAGVANLHRVLQLGRPEHRWEARQLQSELSPPTAAADAARRWLSAGGGQITAETPRFIVADVDALAAWRCFGVRLRRYVHQPSGQHTLIATESIRVPLEIKPLVEFVAGLSRPPRVGSSATHPLLATGDATAKFKITPAVISELYDLPKTTPQTANIQGIAAFNNESFLPADLLQFQDLMRLPRVPVNRTVGPATLPSKGGTLEGSLDVEYMMGVSPSVPTVVWATFGQRYDDGDKKYDNEPFLKWIVNVSATTDPIPHVFSLSYQDYEDTCSAAFMDRLNIEFAAISMRGTTLVTGSGDWGTGCDKADNATFRADFPSSSPYVVSTGATTFPAGSTAIKGTEVGVQFSSGGFSRHFAMPSYQKQGVHRFLAGCKVPHSRFNAAGRGFPDVSAIGVEFQIVANAEVASVGGTSASSPTFGAILSLINSERLSRGKRTIGWANPLLHAAAAASSSSYHDVIEGNNAFGQCSGFNATTGWDPMTGWGTPNWPVLAAHLIRAP